MARVTRRAYTGAALRVACIAAVLFIWWGAWQGAMAARTVDYLYVQPNEGDSSGGHVAIRFGDETFHFQHESPGILRLQRTDSAAFGHAYSMLGNRAIHESSIAVSDETYSLLRDAFARLLVVQDAQLELRDDLHRNAEFFSLLLRERRHHHQDNVEISLPLAALGYFLADGTPYPPPPSGTPPSPPVLSLRNRIRATYGEHFIEEKMTQVESQLRELELRATKPVLAISPQAFAAPLEPPVSKTFHNKLLALFALQLLQDAPPLRPGTFWTSDDASFRLHLPDGAVLKKYAAELERDLVGLATSQRPDWGLPFVIGMARLSAISASLATGRLVLLNIFPAGSELPPDHDRALRRYLEMMEKDMGEVFGQKRKSFFTTKSFREADYAAMERSGNLLLDMQRAVVTGSALRKPPEGTLPSLEATVRVPSPDAQELVLERELAAARSAEDHYLELLERLHGYDLLSRNCVTELFAVINRVLENTAASQGGSLRLESVKRLGGFIDAADGLDFIPLLSSRTVESTYAVTGSRDLPSYRTVRLAGMKEREGSIKILLRESNTITSSVYRPGPEDSAFIFFTDDNWLLRPLFGAFNLVAGLSEGILGLLTMPVEGPQRFISGTRGALFSLPELFFVNLRKGSMAYVERSADPFR